MSGAGLRRASCEGIEPFAVIGFGIARLGSGTLIMGSGNIVD